MFVDKICNQQVLGCLMKHPQYLSEVDKYYFTLEDFSTRFERYIYSAIVGLYRGGATNIAPIDIDNYLNVDSVAHATFEQQNGIEYLQDVDDFCEVGNFQFYYDKFKKLNLLRDLMKQGIDVSDFYVDDLTKPNAEKINSKFEQLTTQEIIEGIKKKLIKLEGNYVKTGEVEVESIADGIDEFLTELDASCEVGAAIQGEIYNQVISGAQAGVLTIRSAPSGVGKAIPNYTIIPTPNGDRRVDEIQVGDYLWGDDGNPTKVVAVYPQSEPKEIYRIYFKDGRIAECCKEHLWAYYNANAKNPKQINVNNTEYLANQKLILSDHQIHFSVPLNHPVILPERKNLYPSPYAMGALLGDGSFRYVENQRALTISGQDEEIIKLTAEGLNANYIKSKADNFSWIFKLKSPTSMRKNLWVEEALKNYPDLWNVKSEEKFIPEDYLNGSVEQRFELLRGLLDTDGTIDKKSGHVVYFTNSKQMVLQVQKLCWSLGVKATIAADAHKPTSVVYNLSIQCEKKIKPMLFNLTRKKDIAVRYANNGKRAERRGNNGIIKIEATGLFTEMTCFTVDNKSHLFLMNDYIVTHNTRNTIADACYLAFPLCYNSYKHEWEQHGSSEKVLVIITEQTIKQIKKMVLAYLTDINESRFKYGQFTEEEKLIISQAQQVMIDYADNFILIKCPNPTIELIKTLIRENVLTKDIQHVFYDYIFIGTALLNEFKGAALRNDELLLLFATALKDLAVELNVSMFTSTQVNAQADDNTNIRNEACLAGGRSTINKADNGSILARPTKEELDILERSGLIAKYGAPNIVTDVFKVRSGQWTQVRIWSQVDLGRLKKRDLFITDARLDPIEGFFDEKQYIVDTWDDDEKSKLEQYIAQLNRKE